MLLSFLFYRTQVTAHPPTRLAAAAQWQLTSSLCSSHVALALKPMCLTYCPVNCGWLAQAPPRVPLPPSSSTAEARCRTQGQPRAVPLPLTLRACHVRWEGVRSDDEGLTADRHVWCVLVGSVVAAAVTVQDGTEPAPGFLAYSVTVQK